MTIYQNPHCHSNVSSEVFSSVVKLFTSAHFFLLTIRIQLIGSFWLFFVLNQKDELIYEIWSWLSSASIKLWNQSHENVKNDAVVKKYYRVLILNPSLNKSNNKTLQTLRYFRIPEMEIALAINLFVW